MLISFAICFFIAGHLLGHEGPGSLLSELKRRGWVNALVGGPREGAIGFAFFTVDVDLSEEGEEHVEDILELLFQYLSMIRAEGAKEWIHEECKNVNELKFRFKVSLSVCLSGSVGMHFSTGAVRGKWPDRYMCYNGHWWPQGVF